MIPGKSVLPAITPSFTAHKGDGTKFCIFLGARWNPAVEEQAIMRVHRLGQKSTVKVTRLIVKDSIEERMLQVQERKRLMCDGALGGSSDRATRLEDLQMLFGS